MLQRQILYGKVLQRLKNQTVRIVNYEKKEMTALTGEENKSYENQKVF